MLLKIIRNNHKIHAIFSSDQPMSMHDESSCSLAKLNVSHSAELKEWRKKLCHKNVYKRNQQAV